MVKAYLPIVEHGMEQVIHVYYYRRISVTSCQVSCYVRVLRPQILSGRHDLISTIVEFYFLVKNSNPKS